MNSCSPYIKEAKVQILTQMVYALPPYSGAVKISPQKWAPMLSAEKPSEYILLGLLTEVDYLLSAKLEAVLDDV